MLQSTSLFGSQTFLAMAMHDLVPLDQPLLPSNLATAFGLEQPETEPRDEYRPQQQTLQALANASQPAWAAPGGFMSMGSGIPQTAQALQPNQMPPPGYDQQLNSAGMGGIQQPFHGRSAQQSTAAPSTAGSSVAGAVGQPASSAGAATAGRADTKGNAGVAMTKKPRVAWTPDLHKRFVDAVTELGVHTAVPKAIMQVRLAWRPRDPNAFAIKCKRSATSAACSFHSTQS